VNGVLEDAVAGLAAAVGLLAVAIVLLRVAGGRRRQREQVRRPRAELAIALFLIEADAAPRAETRTDRAILFEVALEMLADLRGVERARLAAFLDQFGYVNDGISLLATGRRRARRRAAEILAAVSPAIAVPALTVGLGDRDVLVRTTCARALAGLAVGDGEKVLPAVATTVQRDAIKAPGAAAEVVLALGMNQPSALASLLTEKDRPQARAIAVAVVGQLRLSQHAPLLRACLGDGDELAALAARGLGLICDVDSLAELMDAASDSRRAPIVRAAAVTALGSIGDPSALRLLECQLETTDWALRAAAAAALSRLGTPGADALRRAAGSSDPEIRGQAEAVLQR
jgi:HEAT repeat protein